MASCGVILCAVGESANGSVVDVSMASFGVRGEGVMAKTCMGDGGAAYWWRAARHRGGAWRGTPLRIGTQRLRRAVGQTLDVALKEKDYGKS